MVGRVYYAGGTNLNYYLRNIIFSLVRQKCVWVLVLPFVVFVMFSVVHNLYAQKK